MLKSLMLALGLLTAAASYVQAEDYPYDKDLRERIAYCDKHVFEGPIGNWQPQHGQFCDAACVTFNTTQLKEWDDIYDEHLVPLAQAVIRIEELFTKRRWAEARQFYRTTVAENETGYQRRYHNLVLSFNNRHAQPELRVKAACMNNLFLVGQATINAHISLIPR